MCIRRLLFGFATALIAAGTFQAPPATAQSYNQLQKWCFGDETDEQTIQGCNAVINSRRDSLANIAKAFDYRGFAYYHKGQYDRAIQDYDQAIKLDPKSDNAFNDRGLAYNHKYQYDRAIQDFDQAIRLNPKSVNAFNNRGISYDNNGQYDRAIQDYDQAIKLNPSDPDAFNNRGISYANKNQYDRAIRDFDSTIKLDPKRQRAFISRGAANLYAGALPKAFADLDHASALDPKYAYAALWLEIVGQRSNVASRLPQAVSTIDMTKWPAPVIRMFLGQTPPAAVLAAAEDPDATKKKGQICEANFYSGEWALRQGAKDEALRLFRLAADECPRDFSEWRAAVAELKALGAK